MPTPELSPSQSIMSKLLDAVLPHVPFDGWSKTALDNGQKDADLTDNDVAIAAPGGVADLVEAFFDRANHDARARYTAELTEDMRIRDKVTLGVSTWLDTLEPNKLAVRKALGYSATHPFKTDRAIQRAWSVADMIWTTLGDTSEDFNYYSKRTILSGVIASTVIAWLASDDRAATDAFLDNRIANVMTIEKLKARFRKAS